MGNKDTFWKTVRKTTWRSCGSEVLAVEGVLKAKKSPNVGLIWVLFCWNLFERLFFFRKPTFHVGGHLSYPIASMYGIYTYIYHNILPLRTTIHVGKYTSPMDGMGMTFNNCTPLSKKTNEVFQATFQAHVEYRQAPRFGSRIHRWKHHTIRGCGLDVLVEPTKPMWHPCIPMDPSSFSECT